MPYDINETITDIPTLLKEISGQSTAFGVGLILFVWVFITLTGYFSQDRRTGRASMPMWLTIGGFFTTLISFVLFLMDGIIALPIVTTTMVLFLVFASWFIFSSDR